MGKRGPAPTPSAVLRLRGSWRGEYGNHNEPQPEKTRPRCPPWIDAYAKAAWKQLVPQLDRMGVLTRIDGHALTILCQTWARWRKATEFIQQHGETYPIKDAEGRIKYLRKFPQVQTAEACAKTLQRFMQEFGLTPASRTRIEVPTSNENQSDGKTRFLNVG